VITDRRDGSDGAISLQYENGAWKLQEINADQVLLNGMEVKDAVKIRIDDCIEIGDTKFYFEGSGLVYGYPTQGSGLSINIDERAAHQAMRKVTLLKDINLSIEPGNMVLILGGSGAGKSTFVNAVTGYEKAKATIKEGDLDYYRDYGQVKHRIGFVPQDNLMREDDTVGDTVSNAAEMRLPKNMPAEEKEKRVTAVLSTFGLAGREKEKVSKLSGGQKKRLSICMEFVSSPTLFILDEPDSGLDGIMATELMITGR
jgi:ABC-type multidrug transport system ATPase subunit